MQIKGVKIIITKKNLIENKILNESLETLFENLLSIDVYIDPLG